MNHKKHIIVILVFFCFMACKNGSTYNYYPKDRIDCRLLSLYDEPCNVLDESIGSFFRLILAPTFDSIRIITIKRYDEYAVAHLKTAKSSLFFENTQKKMPQVNYNARSKGISPLLADTIFSYAANINVDNVEKNDLSCEKSMHPTFYHIDIHYLKTHKGVSYNSHCNDSISNFIMSKIKTLNLLH